MVRLSCKGSFLPGSSHVRMIVRHFDSLRSDADLICDYKSLWFNYLIGLIFHFISFSTKQYRITFYRFFTYIGNY